MVEQACDECRKRHVSCDAGKPCKPCVVRNLTCKYASKRREFFTGPRKNRRPKKIVEAKEYESWRPLPNRVPLPYKPNYSESPDPYVLLAEQPIVEKNPGMFAEIGSVTQIMFETAAGYWTLCEWREHVKWAE